MDLHPFDWTIIAAQGCAKTVSWFGRLMLLHFDVPVSTVFPRFGVSPTPIARQHQSIRPSDKVGALAADGVQADCYALQTRRVTFPPAKSFLDQ
jgi:hypothetical protein